MVVIFHTNYLLPSLQKSAYDPDVAVLGGCVNRPGPALIRHVQVNALLEQHRRAFRVPVQRGYVHQRRAVLRSFEYARLEFVGKQLDDGSVPVLRRQMHGCAILMIGDGCRRSYAVKILDESLIALRARYVQRCLSVALRKRLPLFHSYPVRSAIFSYVLHVHRCSVIHQYPHHIDVSSSGREMERRIAGRGGSA